MMANVRRDPRAALEGIAPNLAWHSDFARSHAALIGWPRCMPAGRGTGS